LSDLAKFLTTRMKHARPFCDSWASCLLLRCMAARLVHKYRP